MFNDLPRLQIMSKHMTHDSAKTIKFPKFIQWQHHGKFIKYTSCTLAIPLCCYSLLQALCVQCLFAHYCCVTGYFLRSVSFKAVLTRRSSINVYVQIGSFVLLLHQLHLSCQHRLDHPHVGKKHDPRPLERVVHYRLLQHIAH